MFAKAWHFREGFRGEEFLLLCYIMLQRESKYICNDTGISFKPNILRIPYLNHVTDIIM